MFIISKVFWIAGQPLSIALLCCLIALASILKGYRRLAIVLMTVPSLLLFVALFTTAGAVMMQQLEDRFPRPADPQTLDCMIVLGGGFATDVATIRGGYNINDAGDRYIEAFRLMQKYPNAKVLVSGGDGFITGGFLGDAEISERMYSELGIDRDRLLEERDSRTTYENALNSKNLLEKFGLKDCLLITSGFHMPRSVGVFRKLNINVIPWVTDYRSTGIAHLWFDISQPDSNASMLAIATKEWVGMIAYYFAGRTSAFFPMP